MISNSTQLFFFQSSSQKDYNDIIITETPMYTPTTTNIPV